MFKISQHVLTKQLLKSVLYLSTASILLACASIYKVEQCYSSKDEVWSEQVKSLTKQAWPYAVMAASAYGYTPYKTLPEGFIAGAQEPNHRGLAYSVFTRGNADNPEEIIIAFRGSEHFSPREFYYDWIAGNIFGTQNKPALRAYEKVIKDYKAKTKNIPVTVTGHSLGGGLSTHVSLNTPNAKAYVFNSSPRFWNIENAENERFSIAEYGDPLKVLRIFGPEPTQLYTSINCQPGLNLSFNHSMKAMSDCLIGIAAESGDKQAIAFLKLGGQTVQTETLPQKTSLEHSGKQTHYSDKTFETCKAGNTKSF